MLRNFLGVKTSTWNTATKFQKSEKQNNVLVLWSVWSGGSAEEELRRSRQTSEEKHVATVVTWPGTPVVLG